ncbi:hypothetical protein M0R45_012366 [Rubus argutus]|uniref:Uncharacterized protein n=1 Tax=Rubus argutus TaxID=59490 RepID=A0AAW1YE12_RUBAR
MGAVCSAGFSDENTKYGEKSLGFSGKLKSSVGKLKDNFSFSEEIDSLRTPHKYDSGELRSSFSSELKPSTPARNGAAKITQRNSFIGRAGTAGLEKAVGVLDTLGSSMSNLQTNSGFLTGVLEAIEYLSYLLK